ncbi:MAG: Hsp20/alpha crystallin family protein [Bacteroidota bacterium]|nr:Hsp20/alpha crystallin family protein [Bacteroidota bacterium]MDP3145422.1 Hsp20/alpha crystallin family protein [Bacteroidota bacterium]MDP3557199.1 Hsp20/alpha crystallin family protein [Bacteroidota bacterium]
MKSLIKLNSNNNNLMFPEFPLLFDDFLTRDFFNPTLKSTFNQNSMPAVNVKETDVAFELEIAAPGMEKQDFKIELEQNTLMISAQQENKVEDKEEEGKYTIKEFSYRSFKRSFHLPENLVNDNEIIANYKDGILHICIPKKEPTKQKIIKEISIT